MYEYGCCLASSCLVYKLGLNLGKDCLIVDSWGGVVFRLEHTEVVNRAGIGMEAIFVESGVGTVAPLVGLPVVFVFSGRLAPCEISRTLGADPTR